MANSKKISLNIESVKQWHCINIYWDKIEAASNYIVSLWKNNRHLKDIAVDRTDGYLVLDGLVGDDYYIKVKAENKNGKIIAEEDIKVKTIRIVLDTNDCYPDV